MNPKFSSSTVDPLKIEVCKWWDVVSLFLVYQESFIHV